MNVLNVRNVSAALPQGIRLLEEVGDRRDSRNGPVLVSPHPVTTVYQKPMERFVEWERRDSNIAFLVYEGLWMLAGRNDVAPLKRYVKDFDRYSDDGALLHGAYGHRWRKHFGFDQLAMAVDRLKTYPDDRRTVVAMWDPRVDLLPHDDARDVPCNDTITFQRGKDGRLNMVVFCRSNDVIWGAYFANAYHFSVLLEYLARWIGCHPGTYSQVSVNYHAYVQTLEPLKNLYAHPSESLYGRNVICPTPISNLPIDEMDAQIQFVLDEADHGFAHRGSVHLIPWLQESYTILLAHHIWRTKAEPERYDEALDVLNRAVPWKAAKYSGEPALQAPDSLYLMAQWIHTRRKKWEEKLLAS